MGPVAPSAGLVAALDSEGLWQGFVAGLGGAVAADGKFALTAPKTVAAIQALVELVQAYAVPGEVVDALPGKTSSGFQAEVLGLYAMTFAPLGFLPPGFSWARLPRFPVRPIIPIVSWAVGLTTRRGVALPAPDSPAALAAVGFALAQGQAGSIRFPPASASASIQRAYWSGPAPGPAAVLGDWQNFRDAYDGYPVIPGRDYVTDAIAQALTGKSSLAAALAHAEQQMNAGLG